MLILWLNKRVPHGGGVGAGTALWHPGCIHTGVASQHSGSQSRTCSPAPVSYVEQEMRGCLPVQRSTPPEMGTPPAGRAEWGAHLKTFLRPAHARKSKEKVKAGRGRAAVSFWFSFIDSVPSKAMRLKLWVSFTGCLPRKELGVSRTLSGWRTGCIVTLPGGIRCHDWRLQCTERQDKAERLNQPNDF